MECNQQFTPYVVKEIYPDITTRGFQCGATLGQDLICSAPGGLWKTDGTASDTVLVDDEPQHGWQDNSGQFTSTGSLFYFVGF